MIAFRFHRGGLKESPEEYYVAGFLSEKYDGGY